MNYKITSYITCVSAGNFKWCTWLLNIQKINESQRFLIKVMFQKTHYEIKNVCVYKNIAYCYTDVGQNAFPLYSLVR